MMDVSILRMLSWLVHISLRVHYDPCLHGQAPTTGSVHCTADTTAVWTCAVLYIIRVQKQFRTVLSLVLNSNLNLEFNRLWINSNI